jgi:uncharacterized membrane protein YjjP (DUF1212 family)
MDLGQERGRRTNRIRSLSPPQRTLSRSHSRERSRSRDPSPSPFSIDSKLATNYVVNNPHNNPSIREMNEYVPIMEDDELNIQMSPILPQFSRNKNKNVADPSDLNQIPLPNEPELAKEIYDDFQEQFKKDTKLKSDIMKKKHRAKENDKESNFVSSRPGRRLRTNLSTSNSSTDYSTDLSDADADVETADAGIDKRQPTRSLLYELNTASSADHNSSLTQNPLSYSPKYNIGLSPDISSPDINHAKTNLLTSALQKINDTQDESQPSKILNWINRVPKNFSLGHLMSRNNDEIKKVHNDYIEDQEGYDLSDLSNITNDIESNSMKRTGSSSMNILKIANNLVHGKKKHGNSEFDMILNDFNKKKFDSENSTSDSFTMKNGITSNLMKLYNQIPDSSEDDIFSDSDDENYGRKYTEGSSAANIPHKMANRVRKFKNSGIFSSRENSREPRPHKDINHSAPDLNSIKLPDFSLSKEDKLVKKIKKKTKKEKAARITVHIVDLIHRQEFLLTLCKAFMLFGAPNHRLEEYMTLTAKVLEVDATFIYLPGMMLANFSDPVTRTSDLKLVRVGQGLNLSKLDLAHDIYESVVYDRIGVDEASKELDKLFESKDFLNTYWIILSYGLSSMFVLIFFNGAWLDMIPSFILGSLLGFLQCVVAPKNVIYSSVFEVGSAIMISFIGRAVGSIDDGKYFCFSAIVLSGLCMILPGYMILRGALEIQSKSIVSGVVGMFYAIIYSLFLGFGLTLGSALYGWFDKSAYNKTSCSNIGHIDNIWKLLFVPLFNVFQAFACQGRFHQLSIMVFIACCGYLVTYFSSLHFGIAQFNSALGSFTVGLLSNIYDRWGKSFKRIGYCSTKFSSMICGIFDLVPGGFAARNVLSSGLVQIETNGNSTGTDSTNLGTLTFGISMIEIAIGITVGLFVSTLVVYPLGPKKNEAGNTIGL